MPASTANSFPALHGFNMSRSWFLAAIVLVHLGFFWALTSHTVYIFKPPQDGTILIQTDPVVKPPPVPPKPIDVPVQKTVWVPPAFVQPTLPPDPPGLQLVNNDPTPPVPQMPMPTAEGPGAGPYIVEPQLDSRYPFSEPEYPVSEIRQLHEGTVLLSLQILPNGRVGEVRIEQSSGYPKLDEAAAREARRWRMKPGTSDGVAMAMWKRVPIKFQLKN
jgi:protein TonB